MRGLWLEDRKLTSRDDLPVPSPEAGEALVRVLAAGICGTDLELVKGYYPYTGIPGHEFVGRVESCPDAPQWVGRRVVGEINAVCGDCRACAANRRAHCERRSVLGILRRHGAFAEFLTLPAANLHAVPDTLADDVAVFTEPSAAALRVLEQVRVTPDLRVLVVGDGRLGTLVAQALVGTGAEVLVTGRHPAKLERLRARGALSAAPDALPVARFDLAVECTGNFEGFSLARRALRPGGTLVLKSTYHGESRLDLSSVVVDEIALVGSRCGPFAPALRALASGRIDVSGLVDARFGLHSGPQAFERAAQPGVMKVLLEP